MFACDTLPGSGFFLPYCKSGAFISSFSTTLREEKCLSCASLCCFDSLLSLWFIDVALDVFVKSRKALFNENIVPRSYKIPSFLSIRLLSKGRH